MQNLSNFGSSVSLVLTGLFMSTAGCSDRNPNPLVPFPEAQGAVKTTIPVEEFLNARLNLCVSSIEHYAAAHGTNASNVNYFQGEAVRNVQSTLKFIDSHPDLTNSPRTSLELLKNILAQPLGNPQDLVKLAQDLVSHPPAPQKL